jgi:hypothetical protein
MERALLAATGFGWRSFLQPGLAIARRPSVMVSGETLFDVLL